MSSPFKFKPTETGFAVYVRNRLIGEILPAKEASGRHCFYLACDDRKDARTYRGKIKAAEALHVIDQLTSDAKKKRWSVEKLIVMAWDARPRASEAP